MRITFEMLGDAVYALAALALLYLGWLAGVAVADFRQWLARRAAARPVSTQGGPDLDPDVYAWLCPPCNGTPGSCCCVTHCGSQACRAGQAVWHG